MLGCGESGEEEGNSLPSQSLRSRGGYGFKDFQKTLLWKML